MTFNMQAERHRQILAYINQHQQISVAQVCEMFGVSEMTARRDLRELDREGLLRRVHGGAMNGLGRSYEPPYLMRSTYNAEVKRAIGEYAASLIEDGDSIALDVGTTTLEIARALEGKRNLTVLTASLPIANEIVSRFPLDSEIRLILTGGIVRAGELSMVGQFPAHFYSEIHVDKAFLGMGGISLDDGLTEYNLEDALVKKSLIKSAQQTILVVDGSKFGRTTFASVAPLSAIDRLITDSSVPTDMLKILRSKGIEVHLVDVAE